MTDGEARDHRSGQRGRAQAGDAAGFMRPRDDAHDRLVVQDCAAAGRQTQAMLRIGQVHLDDVRVGDSGHRSGQRGGCGIAIRRDSEAA